MLLFTEKFAISLGCCSHYQQKVFKLKPNNSHRVQCLAHTYKSVKHSDGFLFDFSCLFDPLTFLIDTSSDHNLFLVIRFFILDIEVRIAHNVIPVLLHVSPSFGQESHGSRFFFNRYRPFLLNESHYFPIENKAP